MNALDLLSQINKLENLINFLSFLDAKSAENKKPSSQIKLVITSLNKAFIALISDIKNRIEASDNDISNIKISDELDKSLITAIEFFDGKKIADADLVIKDLGDLFLFSKNYEQQNSTPLTKNLDDLKKLREKILIVTAERFI